MENLNKENFWNDLHKKYPDAVDHFCKWIDEYKKEVNWDILFPPRMVPPNIVNQIEEMFSAISDIPDNDPDKSLAYSNAEEVRDKMLSRYSGIKFHDLPFEMQVGIIIRYELELFGKDNPYSHMADYRKEKIIDMFSVSQRNINKSKS